MADEQPAPEQPTEPPKKRRGRPPGVKPWPTKRQTLAARPQNHQPPRTPKVRKKHVPDLLTDEAIEKIVNAVKAGNHLGVAAAFAGVSRITLYRWLQKGARHHPGRKGRYEKLHEALTQAMAEGEVRNVATVAKAGAAGDWKAAAWLLERRHRKRWGKQEPPPPPSEKELGLEVKVLPARSVDPQTGKVIDAEEVRQLPAGEPAKEE